MTDHDNAGPMSPDDATDRRKPAPFAAHTSPQIKGAPEGEADKQIAQKEQQSTGQGSGES